MEVTLTLSDSNRPRLSLTLTSFSMLNTSTGSTEIYLWQFAVLRVQTELAVSCATCRAISCHYVSPRPYASQDKKSLPSEITIAARDIMMGRLPLLQSPCESAAVEGPRLPCHITTPHLNLSSSSEQQL